MRDIIVAFGGMRFTSMDLENVQGAQLLLEACADTLQTLRMLPDERFQRCKRIADPWEDLPNPCADVVSPVFPQHFNFSCNTTLRSLEVQLVSIITRQSTNRLSKLLPTIKSPTFSEIVVVFSEMDVYMPSQELARALRQLYEIKEFRVAFCLETLDGLRAQGLRQLQRNTNGVVKGGIFDFLPCPPLVFSRTVTGYDRSVSSPRERI